MGAFFRFRAKFHSVGCICFYCKNLRNVCAVGTMLSADNMSVLDKELQTNYVFLKFWVVLSANDIIPKWPIFSFFTLSVITNHVFWKPFHKQPYRNNIIRTLQTKCLFRINDNTPIMFLHLRLVLGTNVIIWNQPHIFFDFCSSWSLEIYYRFINAFHKQFVNS